MKTNKTAVTLLVLLAVVLGGYAWYTLSRSEPVVETINYQTQQVETVADPATAVTEEVAAVGAIETDIDAQLDAVENLSF